MQMRRGFTIVEMVVTLAIMAILLTLTVVSLNVAQVNARDSKRESDVKAIARGLEVRYKQGDPRATESCTNATAPGQYPGINEMLHASGWDRDVNCWSPVQIVGGYMTDELPGTSKNVLTTPTGGGLGLTCVYACSPAGTLSQITDDTDAGNYAYEPVDANGQVCCCSGCVSFKIYYKKEKDGSLQSISSEHQ